MRIVSEVNLKITDTNIVQEKKLSKNIGKPYLMFILRLGKQKLVSYRDLYVRNVLRLQL